MPNPHTFTGDPNDVYYAKNISFILDVKIIFKTIKTVLFRENVNVTRE